MKHPHLAAEYQAMERWSDVEKFRPNLMRFWHSRFPGSNLSDPLPGDINSVTPRLPRCALRREETRQAVTKIFLEPPCTIRPQGIARSSAPGYLPAPATRHSGNDRKWFWPRHLC